MVSLETIVRSMMDELRAHPLERIRYLHHIGDIELPLDSIKSFIDDETGGDVAELLVDEWAVRAGSQGLHEVFIALLTDTANLRTVVYPRNCNEQGSAAWMKQSCIVYLMGLIKSTRSAAANAFRVFMLRINYSSLLHDPFSKSTILDAILIMPHCPRD